jgi:hypothetical protein
MKMPPKAMSNADGWPIQARFWLEWAVRRLRYDAVLPINGGPISHERVHPTFDFSLDSHRL